LKVGGILSTVLPRDPILLPQKLPARPQRPQLAAGNRCCSAALQVTCYPATCFGEPIVSAKMTSESASRRMVSAKAFDSQRQKKPSRVPSDTQARRELYGGLRKKFPCLISIP